MQVQYRPSTEEVKKLREETGAGIMECRRALQEAGGNWERAKELLREWGAARAEKKVGRVARQGLVEAYVHAGGRIGVLVEVNCETDFVARNEQFRQLAHDIAMQIAATNPPSISDEVGAEAATSGGEASPYELPLLKQPFIKDPSITIEQLVREAIGRLGENIVIRRFARFELGA